jgi:hypothetical protein
MISADVSNFLADFRPKTHAIVFYDSLENKRDLLFSHLKFGADHDEGLAYVCSEERPERIIEHMNNFGINTKDLRDRNRLTVNNYNRIYIVDGLVNISNIMNAFAELSTKYVAMGLRGMRASAEMSCFFNEGKVKELMAYEYALHRKFAFPAEGICAYNILDLIKSDQFGLVMDLVRAHDPVIIFGPKDTLILEPEKVGKKEFEETMKVRLN